MSKVCCNRCRKMVPADRTWQRLEVLVENKTGARRMRITDLIERLCESCVNDPDQGRLPMLSVVR